MAALSKTLALFVLLSLLTTAATAQVSEGFVVTDDGAWIHYLEDGPAEPAGPTLLFVPGWTLPAWIWEAQIEHFGADHRVVAMDPRSQGSSSREVEGLYPAARATDIRAVVKDLKLSNVVLVGHSMGVRELLSYVRLFGTEGVAGLVLVDGTAGEDLSSDLAGSRMPWLHSFQTDRRQATDDFVRLAFLVRNDEAYLKRVVEASLRTPTSAAIALSVGMLATDNRDVLPQIDRPTLVVAAQGPWTTQVKEMAGHIPGAGYSEVENAGHCLFADQPAHFNSLVGDFLEGLLR